MHPKTLGIWRAATWWSVKEAEENTHTVLGAKDQERDSEIDPEEIKHPTERHGPRRQEPRMRGTKTLGRDRDVEGD